MDLSCCKYVVVGAGIFGSVVAERIAADLGERVAVIERRSHIGGNCYSELDEESGVERHKYGSHIFHTDNERVWRYMNRFCSFNWYRHKVLTRFRDRVYHMPVNLDTLNSFYGTCLTPTEARAFVEAEAARCRVSEPRSFEDKAVSMMGRPMYEAFVKGYTAKQWETDPRELPGEIVNRIPIRFNYDVGYFSDPWQGIPVEGYTAVFRKLLGHPNIELHLGVDFFDLGEVVPRDATVVFTGPIDRFFGFRHGRLTYRSLRFEEETVPVDDFQGTAVMNYADADVPYTRIHEFKHYHPERRHRPGKTAITREYSRAYAPGEERYYPVGTFADRCVLEAYQAEARSCPRVLFGGRLGSYAYLDMDDAVRLALETYDRSIAPGHAPRLPAAGADGPGIPPLAAAGGA